MVEAGHDLRELHALGGEERFLALFANLEGVGDHLDRSISDFHLIFLALETKLTVFVLAKRVDEALSRKGEGVEGATADTDDFFVGEILHEHRLSRRHLEACPKPAIGTIAPHV